VKGSLGNSLTSREMVWNYWMHRCAELTKEKGLTALAIVNQPQVSSTSPSLANNEAAVMAMFNPSDTPRKTLTKGVRVPIFIHTPGAGSTVTTFYAGGLVSMFSPPLPEPRKTSTQRKQYPRVARPLRQIPRERGSTCA
jgi:hypothetical protein